MAHLSWDTSGATRVFVEDAPVAETTDGFEVQPTNTTEYVLRAENSVGPSFAALTIAVLTTD
jgi:hypothetical protein